ncbi:DUF397 domain-containing protein [Kitasatospora sp. NPDC057198]|uniref:DUF397 domain-containing protein n=1 Tax=Kitasatospora sp. NPDC057198 TaxID=3346046 RepID=UPI0036407A15
MNKVDMSGIAWRKSSYSSGNGQCVEAAFLSDDVATRDSKDPTGPVLVFPAASWAAFVTAVQADELPTA